MVGEHGGEGRLLVGASVLELWEWSLGPGDERISEPHRSEAHEALLVTEGVVVLRVGASEPVELRAGQSALFRADERHSYENHTKKRARFVLAVHERTGATS